MTRSLSLSLPQPLQRDRGLSAARGLGVRRHLRARAGAVRPGLPRAGDLLRDDEVDRHQPGRLDDAAVNCVLGHGPGRLYHSEGSL